MSIDYEKISDEWLEYIGKLDLDERQKRFKEYLEASGVYDLDSSTTFYLSELNNFLTEGITTLLHDKAQEAKKSGKGLAHYRHTSFALSKPDAMNIVHIYIHKKILSHSTMIDNNITEIPNKFQWDFLFNLPEYVSKKPLLTSSEIPQLPEPHKRSTEQTLNYSPDQYTDDITPNNEFSPDPFDIDERDKEQQIIENLKDKIYTHDTIQEMENEDEHDPEYSPDPYDIDTEQQQYTTTHVTSESAVHHINQDADIDEPITFGGIKHGHIDEPRGTTLLKGIPQAKGSVLSKLQREKSNYLESWMTGSDDKKEDTIMIDNDREDKIESNEVIPLTADSANHKKAGSTIPGGYWKNQMEKADKVMHNLNDATEHRDEILRNINEHYDNNKDHIDDVMREVMNSGEIIRNLRKLIDENTSFEGEKEREREREREGERDKERMFEIKIKDLEGKIVDFEIEIKRKDVLMHAQSIKMKEYQVNGDGNKNMEMMKNAILSEIETQFGVLRKQSINEKQFINQKQSVFENSKINEIMDKTEEIQIKLGSVQKFQQQIKQQNVAINEEIDALNGNNDKYYNFTLKRMAEYHSQLTRNMQEMESVIHNGEEKSNNNNNVHNNMTVLSNITSQMSHDLSAASMLSVMRNEYDNMRKEKDELRLEIERYRNENQILILKKLELEEEAINVRESKRRTIKNLVDELNDLRDQIYRLSRK